MDQTAELVITNLKTVNAYSKEMLAGAETSLAVTNAKQPIVLKAIKQAFADEATNDKLAQALSAGFLQEVLEDNDLPADFFNA